MRGKKSLFVQIRRDGNLYCAADNPALMVAEFDGQFIASETRRESSGESRFIERGAEFGLASGDKIEVEVEKMTPTVAECNAKIDDPAYVVRQIGEELSPACGGRLCDDKRLPPAAKSTIVSSTPVITEVRF
jgi:hypothetical protein